MLGFFTYLVTWKNSVENVFCDINSPKASYQTHVPTSPLREQRNMTQKQANHFLSLDRTLILTSQKEM